MSDQSPTVQRLPIFSFFKFPLCFTLLVYYYVLLIGTTKAYTKPPKKSLHWKPQHGHISRPFWRSKPT
jgi:hypothetical protein